MRILSISRFFTWTAVTGSLALFASLQPQLQSAFEILKNLPLDEISKLWHGLTALLVGGGALGVKHVISIDKRLNDKWYWVSTVMDVQGKKIIRVSKGITIINNLDNWKEREEKPGKVLYGEAVSLNGEAAPNNSFHATNIIAARDQTLFYEWQYYDDVQANGWTRLNWQYTEKKNCIFCFGNRIRIKGEFCMANSYGAGKIDFFDNSSEADILYEEKLIEYMKDKPKTL